MKTIYYYVPPCPVCGSEETGRYVQPPFVNRHYMMIESLKNGELIKFRKTKNRFSFFTCQNQKNLFCTSCGFEWCEEPRTVWLDSDEKDGEISRRHTEQRLQEYMKNNNIDPDKKKFMGGMFSGLTNFF